jgi:hypothetical protein
MYALVDAALEGMVLAAGTKCEGAETCATLKSYEVLLPMDGGSTVQTWSQDGVTGATSPYGGSTVKTTSSLLSMLKGSTLFQMFQDQSVSVSDRYMERSK